MRAGRYQFTKTGAGQFAEVQFTYADLGLTEPSPEPTPITSVAEPATVPDIGEPDAFSPRPLSKDERDAEMTHDSLGNPVDGPATKFSLLGPQPKIYHGPPRDTQAHMNPALIGSNDGTRPSFENGEGYTRSGLPLCAGISQQQYDDMMRTYTRRFPNGRSEAEMERAIRAAKNNINDSFPKG